MKKNPAVPDYGIYAPYVVRYLSILGAILLIFGLFGVTSRYGPWIQVQHVLGRWMLLGCIIVILEAAYMVWGSKVGNRKERDRVVELLGITGDELALDVGCGRGLILHAIAKRLGSGKAVGMDIWNSRDVSGNNPAVTLENAKLEGVADRIEIVNGDARAMPFADNSFDAVASGLVIHNISGDDDRRRAIREVYRVLKPGGRFAILDFQRTKVYAEEFRKCGAMDVKIHGPHYAMFPPVKIVSGKKAKR
ncbi:class I SAM-dependent methyltransferase [Alicyclobacillus acidoterrestris]|uniref:Methyltransferase domain-containing protein n=1 Tax=Alicyclobacillus acidoterrestris (strain ATCC 49025 / DSM 3922 / CIP 106132 / NCIMB 13137 / GD3B) TaxID=1356854 RepID=A0A9E6ZE06_ALIAG|nr:methyltransferase domain-containing protein [Alicyclobacillus acidoterrestris]UNO47682.1 methyltransferase domain-containing protein [Alicyclobacillus acidoterrestris]